MSLIQSENFNDLTTLSTEQTFASLFQNNNQLLDASKLLLPATTLTNNCYSSMFDGCINLKTAPKLPATTLTTGCYNRMFYNCYNLKELICLATNTSTSDYTYRWLGYTNYASKGIFYKNSEASSWTTGISGIPDGWVVKDYVEPITLADKQDILAAGDNIEIVDNTVSAIGYAAGKYATSSFVELPELVIEPYTDITSTVGSDLYFTGDAGATTYTVSGQLLSMMQPMIGMIAFQVGSGNIALLTAYDSTNSTVTLDKTLDADNALSNTQVSKLYMAALVYFSGDAGATTYNIVDSTGAVNIFADAQKIKISDYPIATIVSVDSTNNTITLSETLDASNAVSNAQFMYAIQVNNTAPGMCSHAEGAETTASGLHSHAEGYNTTASGLHSHAEGFGTIASSGSAHAEGYNTTASGSNSHAEGDNTTASGAGSHAEGYSTTASGNRAHTEGIGTTAQNTTEHAEGRYNTSHKASDTYGDAGNTQHSVGIGNKNAFEIMQNGDVYVYGIGGYVGTDTTVQDSTIKTLQAYIASLEARIAALEGA